jgi:hypothetical protein
MRRAKSRLMDELIAASPTAQERLRLQSAKSTMAKWSDAKWLEYHGIKPARNPTNAQMVRFIKQVLANDEASSDQELLEHFVSQGVQPAIAKSWIAKRDQYLRGERNPLPVGKFVTVKAKRLPGGRIELRGIR